MPPDGYSEGGTVLLSAKAGLWRQSEWPDVWHLCGFPTTYELLRIEEDLSAAHLRLARAVVEHLDWAECIKRYDREGTLFYLDPPYWGTAGYGCDFPLDEYYRMGELAREGQGQFVISVNDTPEMHDAVQGLTLQATLIRYTVGQQATEPRGELIITNR